MFSFLKPRFAPAATPIRDISDGRAFNPLDPSDRMERIIITIDESATMEGGMHPVHLDVINQGPAGTAVDWNRVAEIVAIAQRVAIKHARPQQ
jgi:hypothetical protein